MKPETFLDKGGADDAPSPYEPPTVRSEKIFESSALVSCGKLVGQGPCAASQKDS